MHTRMEGAWICAWMCGCGGGSKRTGKGGLQLPAEMEAAWLQLRAEMEAVLNICSGRSVAATN